MPSPKISPANFRRPLADLFDRLRWRSGYDYPAVPFTGEQAIRFEHFEVTCFGDHWQLSLILSRHLTTNGTRLPKPARPYFVGVNRGNERDGYPVPIRYFPPELRLSQMIRVALTIVRQPLQRHQSRLCPAITRSCELALLEPPGWRWARWVARR